MKKFPFTAHPNFLILPAVFFLLYITLLLLFYPEYIKPYAISLIIAIPFLVFEKSIFRSKKLHFVTLYTGSDEEKKKSLKEVNRLFLLAIPVILHVALDLPIVWVLVAGSIVCYKEQKAIYTDVVRNITGNEINEDKLKKEIILGVTSLIAILIIYSYIK